MQFTCMTVEQSGRSKFTLAMPLFENSFIQGDLLCSSNIDVSGRGMVWNNDRGVEQSATLAILALVYMCTGKTDYRQTCASAICLIAVMSGIIHSLITKYPCPG